MLNIEAARAAASAYLRERGYVQEAELVSAGKGDDFPEVRLAAQLIPRRNEIVERYRSALRFYADPDFWDKEGPGGALILSDQGKTAQWRLP
jgi:hypothetical protein